ncbi:hypothetical protein UT300012_24080 [Paraclostridium bifermentans]
MIKLMIVAGKGTASLVKHIEEAGTMHVEAAYESLHSNFKTISNEIIEVDKLVYVHQDSRLEINKEMMSLLKLLKGDESLSYMVDIKEIIFFNRKGTCRDDALKYFKRAMEGARFTNFRFYEQDEAFAVLDISDFILNENERADIKPTYQKIYRKKRNEPVNVLYDPEDINSEVVEPYDLQNLKDYDKAKSKLGKLNNLEFQDGKDPNAINRVYDSPSLSRYNVVDVFEDKNVFIYSGLPRSGTTNNLAYFCASAVMARKSVTVINLSNSTDIAEYLRILEVGHDIYGLKDFMLSDTFGEKFNLNILNIFYKEIDIRLHGLRHILSNVDKIKNDIIVIECPKDILSDVVDCVGFKLNKVFFAMETLEKDIFSMFNYLNNIGDKMRLIVMLSKIAMDYKFSKRLEPSAIKNMLSEDIGVAPPVDYEGCEENEDLYDELINL